MSKKSIVIYKVEQIDLLYDEVSIKIGFDDKINRWLVGRFAVSDGGASEITQKMIDDDGPIIAYED